VLAVSPSTGAAAISPGTPVTVTAGNATITSVTLASSSGTAVTGTLSADGTAWTAAGPLGYDRSYTLTAVASGPGGKQVTGTSTFSTLKPANQTMPSINTTGGGDLTDGATFGVGIVVSVHFDEQIGDKSAAERALHVTTTPAVTGSWYWLDAQNVHWRPQAYYAPGTKVTVAADLYGVQVGPGLFGQADVSKSFVIGAKHVSIADDTTHMVNVYFGDQLVRQMPTSMGRGGYLQGTNGQISLFTPSGTYTVLDQANPVLMDSSSYGLPVNSAAGYKEYIYWATRISTDGIYLHQLNSTVGAQGHYDTSHGCLNLNLANAQWFFQNSLPGDVVQVLHTGGPPLEVWQNGDWTLNWDQWKAGSALAP
jgi:lipoprotein-anchoring transpeptidase ErfK/SrfK